MGHAYNRCQARYGIGTQNQRLETVLQHTPIGARILDLGSGRGAYVKALNRAGRQAVGVDSQFYPEWTQTRTHCVQGRADALPFVSRSFHTTICFEVLEHCPAPLSVLSEVARCTAFQLIISVPNCDLHNALRDHDLVMAHWTDRTHYNFYTKETISNLLCNMGYQIINLLDCYRISINDYFWDTIRIPSSIAQLLKKLCAKYGLTETYWSSILIVAKVPECRRAGES